MAAPISHECGAQISNMRVLITGAGGFLGSHLLRGLRGHTLIAASRRPVGGTEWRQLGDLGRSIDWDGLLRDVDAVVHLANIAHRSASDEEFDRVNRQSTADLCAAAKRAGLRQLVFVSSIAAQVGHSSQTVVTEADAPAPVGAYGRSKLAAERVIAESGVPFTILRPVLVLGEGAKANAASLEKLARLPVPLPLGSIAAERSFLSVENFVSGVATVLGNPRALGETYVIADPLPMTVGEVIAKMRAGMGRRPGIVTLPRGSLEMLMKLPGARAIWERIGKPLVIDPAKLMGLGWSPTR